MSKSWCTTLEAARDPCPLNPICKRVTYHISVWKKRGVAGAKHVKRRGALNSQKRDVLLLKLFSSWSVCKGNLLLHNSFHQYKLFIQMADVGPFFHFETCLEAVGRYWGGPGGNYLDWGEKLGSSWIETRKRAPRLKTSCSHRQSRHIRRDRVARFKPRADDTTSPEGHFHIYEFSDQRVWKIYDQCLLLLKKTDESDKTNSELESPSFSG